MPQRVTAPTKGPAITVRFRSKAEITLLKKAANIAGQSLNTYIIRQAAAAAERSIAENSTVQAAV